MLPMTDTKPHAPATERNRDAIAAVLVEYFADRRRVLEIGSGTGQHAVYFAQQLPHLIWQASDRAERIDGIRQWLDDARLPNTPPALRLDVNDAWPDTRFDAVFSANTLHIMSWTEVQRMFAGVAAILDDHGLLAIYGPFNYGGTFTSDSNRAFDLALKADDPLRGIRDFAAVDALAQSIGLALVADIAMPANNRCLLWRRSAPERQVA